ncbi:hypothetical protein L7F22_050004 [Adiantum nelumboides]|nr:hypothetical protein [Adiantum nelumboides]
MLPIGASQEERWEVEVEDVTIRAKAKRNPCKRPRVDSIGSCNDPPPLCSSNDPHIHDQMPNISGDDIVICEDVTITSHKMLKSTLVTPKEVKKWERDVKAAKEKLQAMERHDRFEFMSKDKDGKAMFQICVLNVDDGKEEDLISQHNELVEDQDMTMTESELRHTLDLFIDEEESTVGEISSFVLADTKTICKSTLVSHLNGNPTLSKDRLTRTSSNENAKEKNQDRFASTSQGVTIGTWYLGRVVSMRRKLGGGLKETCGPLDLLDRPPNVEIHLSWYQVAKGRRSYTYDLVDNQAVSLESIIAKVHLEYNATTKKYVLDANDSKFFSDYVKNVKGLLETNPFVGCALVAMYAKCGSLLKAEQVFKKLPVQDVIAWTTLISAYGDQGQCKRALKCFERMQDVGVFPNAVTFASTLRACDDIGKGKEIHAEVERLGLLEKDIVVEHGPNDEALKWLDRLRSENISPTAAMFVSALKACSTIGATNKAEELHAEIESLGLLGRDLIVGNALLGVYVANGLLARSEDVFGKLGARDVVSWTALMSGYAKLGEMSSVLLTFQRMLSDCVQPDSVVFVVVLTVCARSGAFGKSQTFHDIMTKDYGIVPLTKHRGCVVNMFGRAGNLDSAVAMLKVMPVSSNIVMWRTFLGACREWGCTVSGEESFMHRDRMDSAN